MLTRTKGESPVRSIALLGLMMLLALPSTAHADRMDELAGNLSLGSPSSRLEAVEEIAKIGGPRAEENLIKALSDADTAVRLRAAAELGRLKSRKAIDGLAGRVRFDGAPSVKHQAIRSLEAIGDVKAVPALIRALEDPDPFVVGLAARALGKLGDHRAANPLMSAYESAHHPSTAVEVAIALAKLPEDRFRDFYLSRLGDGSAEVRLMTVKALLSIQAKDAYEYLMFLAERDNDPQVRSEAKKAARKLAP